MPGGSLSKSVEDQVTLLTLLKRLALVLPLLLPAAGAGAAATAGAAIDRLNSGLSAAMNSAVGATFAEREAVLHPLMVETFDYPYMARVAAGRYWSGFEASDQARYLELFETVNVAAAASRFKEAPGVTFTVIGERDGPEGTRFIETELKLASGKTRKIAYLLRETSPGDWRAVDVFYDGTISELATKRSEYTAVIKNQGLEALFAILAEKAADYAKE